MGFSWIRDQTCVPRIGRRILIHWATSEVPVILSYTGLLHFLWIKRPVAKYTLNLGRQMVRTKLQDWEGLLTTKHLEEGILDSKKWDMADDVPSKILTIKKNRERQLSGVQSGVRMYHRHIKGGGHRDVADQRWAVNVHFRRLCWNPQSVPNFYLGFFYCF